MAYQFLYNDLRIVPAPTISIQKDFIYTNDNLTGYTFIVNIKGYASSISPHSANTNNSSSIEYTTRSLDYIHNVLHANGKKLQIKDATGVVILEAFGGKLRSFDASESDNKWVHYIPFTASIEFNVLNIYTTPNGIQIFNNIEIDVDSTQPVGINQLTQRISNYNDSWSFNTSDEEIHSYYKIIHSGEYIQENYSTINVEYKIDATGKHFYEINNMLVPAWDRAKQFVQEKMYHQISMFRRYIGFSLDAKNRILDNNTSPTAYPLSDTNLNRDNFPYDSTSMTDPDDLLLNSLTYSHTPLGPNNPAIFSILINNNFEVFNENIICSTSESDGTFSATYKCVLKQVGDTNFMRNATHRYDITYEETNDFHSSSRNINVNGTIQGLLPTSILSYGISQNEGSPFHFILPYTGPFLTEKPINTNSKFTNKYYYANYHFENDIVNGIKSDLNSDFKKALAITYDTLFPTTSSSVPCLEVLDAQGNSEGFLQLFQLEGKPRNFTITHNYNDGSISYTASYDTDRACAVDRGFEELTITEEDSVPIIAEFVIPGRSNGPIIQNLNTYTNHKITLAFNGVTKKGCVDGNPWQAQWQQASGDIFTYIEDKVKITPKVSGILTATESQHLGRLIKTQDSHNYNPVDGSFSKTVTYIITPEYLAPCNQG